MVFAAECRLPSGEHGIDTDSNGGRIAGSLAGPVDTAQEPAQMPRQRHDADAQ
jgi:hypothetical protein